MANLRNDLRAFEAVAEDEISSTAIPSSNTAPNKDAFKELMSRTAKKGIGQAQPSKQPLSKRTVFVAQDGLGAYTADPSAFPASRVIYHNDTVVVINDLFPKSTVHTLVLPKSSKNLLHPIEAFEDPLFLAEIKGEVEKAKDMVANELRRRFGKFSATERPRLAAMDSDDPPDELPPGRDWSREVIAGIHAGPSMRHLHVHVMSRDMVSQCLKKRAHYQSFTTPFFVQLHEFPLAEDDVRRRKDKGGYLHDDMRCWRCGQEFEKLSKLKLHLDEEFERWKYE